jgi:hypothetical protein
MSFSEAEARIRRLMSRLQQAEHRTSVVQDQILRTRQGIGGTYQTGFQQRCTTTITGKIVGGDAAAAGLAGSTLQVLGHTTANDYGTFSLPLGTYSIAIHLDPTDTSLDLVATGPGTRFTIGSPVTQPVTQCTSNALANIQATPASGYHYMTGLNACQWPLKNTISYSEATVFGTGTLTYNAGTGLWSQNCSLFNTHAAGTCAAASNVPVRIGFTAAGTEQFQCLRSTTTGCPVTGVCGTVPGGTTLGTMGNGISGLARAYTCPNATTLFSVTITANVSSASEFWPSGTGSLSITYFEV